MFRRRWSGLPADPIFASDLKELGYVFPRLRRYHPSDRSHSVLTHSPLPSYFINDIDEIRSIEDPDYYFKYFLTKNERWNERQRFAFNSQSSSSFLSDPAGPNLKTNPPPRRRPQRDPHAPRRPRLHDHPAPPRHPTHTPARPHPHDPQPNQRVARHRILPRVEPVAWCARAPRDWGPWRGVARVGGRAGRGRRQAAVQ